MDTTERLHFHFSLSCIGEGNGSPLQCSCLENPRDGGAWWAAIYGVARSRTRLERLSSSSSLGNDVGNGLILCSCSCEQLSFLHCFFFNFTIFIFHYAGSSLLHGLFSCCNEQGLLSRCGVQASPCGGFSGLSPSSASRALLLPEMKRIPVAATLNWP